MVRVVVVLHKKVKDHECAEYQLQMDVGKVTLSLACNGRQHGNVSFISKYRACAARCWKNLPAASAERLFAGIHGAKKTMET